MLTKELQIGITETIEILKLASQEEIKKIPKKFLEFLNENADKEYKFEITNNISLNDLKIRKETKNILGMIAYNYWSDTPEKKNNFEKILINNQKTYEQKLRDKYNPNDLFKNKLSIIQIEDKSTAIVEYKESIIQKVLNFLYKIFKKC